MCGVLSIIGEPALVIYTSIARGTAVFVTLVAVAFQAICTLHEQIGTGCKIAEQWVKGLYSNIELLTI